MERWEMSPSVVPTRDDLVARLRVRFADIPAEHVRRCVDDLWCCCTHLGVRPEARTIERLAASRLTGVVRGGRPPYPERRTASGPPGSAAPAERARIGRAPIGRAAAHVQGARAAAQPLPARTPVGCDT